MLASVAVADGPTRPWIDRAFALVALAAVLALVVMLARVTPDPRGYATHEALGLTACGWPQIYGKPCPTCGVTTAACWLVHGSPFRALSTQPFGALAMATLLWIAGFALWSLARGRSFLLPFLLLPLMRGFGGTILVFLLAWLWKYETFVP